jgi:hypothetical protein
MVDLHIEVKGANVVNVDKDDERGRRAQEGAENVTRNLMHHSMSGLYKCKM